MEKEELEQWLCGKEVTPPTPAAIAAALCLPVDEVADTTLLRTASSLRSLRFTVAVLHDVFAADIDVRIWLEKHREELDWMSGRQALLAGRARRVEEIAVRTWNDRMGSRV